MYTKQADKNLSVINLPTHNDMIVGSPSFYASFFEKPIRMSMFVLFGHGHKHMMMRGQTTIIVLDFGEIKTNTDFFVMNNVVNDLQATVVLEYLIYQMKFSLSLFTVTRQRMTKARKGCETLIKMQ